MALVSLREDVLCALESNDKASLRNYHHVLREKIKVAKTLTPEELLGLTDIEGSALSRNLGAEVYIPSHMKDYHHKSCIALR